MMMGDKRRQILVWGYFGVIVVLNSIGAVLFRQSQQADLVPDVVQFIFPTMLIACAFVGALIASRQPRNRIGLLLFLPGTSFAPFTDGVVAMLVNGFWAIPRPPTLLYYLFVWFAGWNWILLIFPLLYLLVLFPTGRPLSSRWRWLLHYITFVMLVIPVLGTFADRWDASGQETLAVANPIGFISLEPLNNNILPFFFVALPVGVAFCFAALFVRFWRARGVEREQIKWLFFASAVFAATYITTFIGGDFTSYAIRNSLWMLGMMLVPIAIGIAILRHRLFDIDVIIRKTVQYGVVTAVLALVYFGTIILLQSLVGQATGEQSPIIIVFSTLLIAAIFSPLRQRVQTAVDRRFYRQKYDAQQVLAQFAQTARDEVDTAALMTELTDVIQKTMQPKQVSVWLKPTKPQGKQL